MVCDPAWQAGVGGVRAGRLGGARAASSREFIRQAARPAPTRLVAGSPYLNGSACRRALWRSRKPVSSGTLGAGARLHQSQGPGVRAFRPFATVSGREAGTIPASRSGRLGHHRRHCRRWRRSRISMGHHRRHCRHCRRSRMSLGCWPPGLAAWRKCARTPYNLQKTCHAGACCLETTIRSHLHESSL